MEGRGWGASVRLLGFPDGRWPITTGREVLQALCPGGLSRTWGVAFAGRINGGGSAG